MSKIVTKIMKIAPSPSADVVGYRVRVAPTNTPVTYETAFYETAELDVDVSKIPALKDADGKFDFFVSAFDRVGNESDFAGSPAVDVDFFAPAPPSGISFTTV